MSKPQHKQPAKTAAQKPAGDATQPEVQGDTVQGNGEGEKLPPALVQMIRDAQAYPKPHAAEVHPTEVANYAAGGWVVSPEE